jgi:hypothetical protein
MSDEAETPQKKRYYVPFRATGAVIVEAEDEDEAVDIANQEFGILQLEKVGAIEDLEYAYRYGPDVEETDEAPTEIPGGLDIVDHVQTPPA